VSEPVATAAVNSIISEGIRAVNTAGWAVTPAEEAPE